MASIGKYRRNFMTYKQTSVSMTFFLIYGLLHNVLLITAASTPTLSPTTIFWIYNAFHIFFVDILHCILLPLTLTTPWKHKKRTGQFYVRKKEGVLEPRRSTEGRITGTNKPSATNYNAIHVQTAKNGKFSYLSLETRKLNDVIFGKTGDGCYSYHRNNVQLSTISD